jgi:dTDP-4-amino-4,6-dideoxygalactose transaminase
MKTTVDELALLGGAPAFPEKLHVGRPNVGDRQAFLDRVAGILDRRWFTNAGPLVAEFEARIAGICGVRHCIAMCNGTVALEIATRALGLKGEVIVPAFTFVATANALQWQEITPVFCDVDPRTHNIDPGQVERLVTPRTTGVVGVHVWGRPCAVDALAELCARRNLTLLYDAAHGLGCSSRGRRLGGFGSVEVLSFHATKIVSTFEGGAIVTNDDVLATKIRFMKNFGFSNYDQVDHLGINGKMPEISAAMGLTGLDSFGDFVSANRRNHERYGRELAGVPGLQLVAYDDADTPNYGYVVVEVDEAVAGLGRDVLYRALHAENVLARRYFYPGVHRMEPYRSLFPHASLLLPETEALVRRVLVLPTGASVSESEVSGVSSLLRLLIGQADEVRARLQSRRAAPAVSPASGAGQNSARR